MEKYRKNLSDYENLRLWDKRPIGEYVHEWAEKYGDKTACITDGEKLSYNELEIRSNELAYGLLELGIKMGDSVVLQLPNCNEFAVVFFALMKIGAIPVMVLPAHRKAEISGLMDKAKPVAYFIADRFQGFSYVELAHELVEEKSFLRYIIVKGESDKFINLDSIRKKEGVLPKVDGYATAQFLLSGGTLGVPKMIPRSHADYMYNVSICSEHCKVDSNTVYLVSLPAEHNFPLSHPGILGTLNAGGTVVFCVNPSADEVLDAITEYKVTITALVPTMAGLCAEFMEYDDDYDVSSLKILQIGGSRCEESLARTIMEKWHDGLVLMQVYGTTEGLAIMTSLDDEKDTIAYYQGREISGATEVRLINTNGEDVADGEIGEVVCRGPYTIDHYHNAPEANGVSFTADGFYRTGDSALRTEDGLFRFTGRVKEQINRAGEKIDPGEIEAYLCSDPRILESAVIGVPDEELNNRSVAFVRCEAGNEVTLNDVYESFTALGVASYKFPDEIEMVESFPLTKVGKIDKKALLDLKLN